MARRSVINRELICHHRQRTRRYLLAIDDRGPPTDLPRFAPAFAIDPWQDVRERAGIDLYQQCPDEALRLWHRGYSGQARLQGYAYIDLTRPCWPDSCTSRQAGYLKLSRHAPICWRRQAD